MNPLAKMFDASNNNRRAVMMNDMRRGARIVRASGLPISCKSGVEHASRSAPAVHTENNVVTASHRRLVCSVCEQHITDDAYRVERAGAHHHTFVNPGGFMHHIACFSIATGIAYRGAPESAFSWFPGHTWQIAACGLCGTQLGWRFHANDDDFYGFIVTAIKYADG